MTGSATAPSGPTDGSSAKPKMLQYYKGQSPILDHLGQRQERPGPDPARGVSAPRFDWTRHSGELGGAFGTGSTARRQRAGW